MNERHKEPTRRSELTVPEVVGVNGPITLYGGILMETRAVNEVDFFKWIFEIN